MSGRKSRPQKISVWQTDEKISWYKFKWTEREGYMYSVKIVAETFLRYLDFFAHLGSSSSRVKSKKRKKHKLKSTKYEQKFT